MAKKKIEYNNENDYEEYKLFMLGIFIGVAGLLIFLLITFSIDNKTNIDNDSLLLICKEMYGQQIDTFAVSYGRPDSIKCIEKDEIKVITQINKGGYHG